MALLAPILGRLLVALAALPQLHDDGNVTPGPGTVSLPRGAAAQALDELERGTAAKPFPYAWPAWDERSSAGWGGEPTWRRWVELLRAERAAATSDPARRAELALVAHLQGRHGEAWVHFTAAANEPAYLATLLPLFMPGVPVALATSAEPLPDGVLLTPALPPSDVPGAGLRQLAGTRLEALSFRIGAATVRLALSVDRDGLEIKLVHLSGGSARVRVLPPVPPGIEPGQVFADWEKRPGALVPIEFTLTAEDPEHTLWLTFQAPRDHLPNPPLEFMRTPDAARGILVLSPGGNEPHLAAFTHALSELFEIPCELFPAEHVPRAGLEPLTIRLDTSSDGERRLAHWLGHAERHFLAARVR
jgi:hypothetical protein